MTATFFRRGRGRSQNAIVAEQLDRMPLTRASQYVAGEARITLALAKRACQVTWDGEWHHVGKYAAETNYYDTQLALDWLSKCVSVEQLAGERCKYEAGQRRAAKAAKTRASAKAAARAESDRRHAEWAAKWHAESAAKNAAKNARREENIRGLFARFMAEPTFGRACELARQGFDPSAL